MTSYTWRNVSNGVGGAFDDPTNWSNTNEAISSTVPSAGDTATFNAGGGGINGTGSVDTISFSAAAWSVIGQLTATTVTLDNGSLTDAASNGQLVVNGSLQVGLSAGAALAVASGALVSVGGNNSAPVSKFGTATLSVSDRGQLTFGRGVSFGVNGLQTSASVNAALMAVGGVFQIGAGGSGPGSASLSIVNGGEVVLSAATDTSAPYLQVGAVGGSYGSLAIDGVNSILVVSNNSGAIGYYGVGTLTVTGGASANFNASANTSNNALNPALTIGRYGIGTVTGSGAGSLIAAGGSIIVGSIGQGTLRLQAGAKATSQGFVFGQSALSIGTAAGGAGAVFIDGSGTSLTASGSAILGGDNRGSGLSTGGTGSISVTNGGLLQTGAMTLLAGSTVAVGGLSQASIAGNLYILGTLSSVGTLVVSGAVYGGGLVQIGGGLADIGQLGAPGTAAVSMGFTSSAATVRFHGVVGANSVTGFQVGDGLDFVGDTSVRLSGNLLTTTTGSVTLSAPPTGSQYAATSDGAGGTFVALTAATIGVYRFFDSNYGTHFFSSAVSEKDNVMATRPDLIYEGVGLLAIDPLGTDPHAAPVYRFFDKNYGTHFFTTSSSERDTVIATRPDLVFEGAGFIEHTAQQAGDTAVYRFFDSNYGTHFYTSDANERAMIIRTRPDLIDEGVGFYAPSR
ncbi:MAG: hypothetical protein RQ966_10565 [Acetobacteraceae bacterium]|nr:hypothetical protein [Acetobacteraceae bacterium]